jgi:hypothetical protein
MPRWSNIIGNLKRRAAAVEATVNAQGVLNILPKIENKP